MTLILCWDIDGTLLSTDRAGIFAWEEALSELIGRPVDLAAFQTAGLTDPEIAHRLLVQFDAAPGPESVRRILGRYEALLPLRLHRRKGRVLPGVLEILEALEGRPDVISLLLTGNTQAGARAKLAYYGLARFFDGGAFSDEAPDRGSIARAALTLASQRARVDVRGEQVFVIGDTPHDIRCAAEVGARAVAVASGGYTLDELRGHHPWWAIERLPRPEAFLAKLQEGVGLAPA